MIDAFHLDFRLVLGIVQRNKICLPVLCFLKPVLANLGTDEVLGKKQELAS